MKRILVLGGYGVFGQRICKRLTQVPDIAVVIAGRDEAKANKLKNTLLPDAKSSIETAEIDIHDIQNLSLEADIIVNASGPYHQQNYSLAEHCIEHGIHYIDLADNREFVCGIDQLNERAKEKDILVTSGASTVPALSSAVLDSYLSSFSELHDIDYGVTPGNQTDRGVGTVAAILSYVGKPFETLINAKNKRVIGWQDLHFEHYPEIGKRWMSNCNIPDLDLFQKRYPTLKTIRFYAGLELTLLHVGLWLLSWPSRWGLIKQPEKLASVLRKMSLWFYSFGSKSGGMHIKMEGLDHHQKPISKNWYLIAHSGDGPFIPTIASVLIVKKLLKGSLKQRGAIPAVGLFTLEEFISEISDLDIDVFDDQPLYKRILKDRYESLPQAVQTLHAFKGHALYEGACDVERGKNPFCKFLAWMLSLPPEGKGHALKVEFSQNGAVETWTRYFGDQKFTSKQWDRNGKLYESINGTTLVFDIETTSHSLNLKLANVLILGIPVRWLFKPKVVAEETEEKGKFCMNINVHLPFFGLLVRYKGWLNPCPK